MLDIANDEKDKVFSLLNPPIPELQWIIFMDDVYLTQFTIKNRYLFFKMINL